MPIYEFRCKKGHNFEVLQRMTDDPVTSCQVCGAPVERVFHPIAVHFKGSGFYNTDYGTRKRSREMKEAKEGSKTESTSDSSSSSKSSDANGNGSKSDSGSAKSDSGSSKSDSGNSKSGSGSGKSERSKAPARD